MPFGGIIMSRLNMESKSFLALEHDGTKEFSCFAKNGVF